MSHISFGDSRKGNTVPPAKPVPSAKKVSPAAGSSASGSSLRKRSALTAFGVEAENDSRLAATLRSKKLDRDLLGLEVQKAKLDIISQRESAQNARDAEANRIKILELQLRLQGQPQPQPLQVRAPVVAQAAHQQMLPANVDMVFGNQNLGMQDLLLAPLENFDAHLNGGMYLHNA